MDVGASAASSAVEVRWSAELKKACEGVGGMVCDAQHRTAAAAFGKEVDLTTMRVDEIAAVLETTHMSVEAAKSRHLAQATASLQELQALCRQIDAVEVAVQDIAAKVDEAERRTAVVQEEFSRQKSGKVTRFFKSLATSAIKSSNSSGGGSGSGSSSTGKVAKEGKDGADGEGGAGVGAGNSDGNDGSNRPSGDGGAGEGKQEETQGGESSAVALARLPAWDSSTIVFDTTQVMKDIHTAASAVVTTQADEENKTD